MQRFKIKRAIKLNIYIITIVFIVVLSIIILSFFNNNISPSINHLANIKIKELSKRIIVDAIKDSKIYNTNYKNVLDIKYDNNTITGIDYKLEYLYESLEELNDYLTKNIDDIENGKIRDSFINETIYQKSNNGLILLIPSGYVYKNSLLANIGPSIPLKILFVGSTLANLETKVTSYGLNNALLEIYIVINIENELAYLSKYESTITTEKLLISAQVIQGKVPYLTGITNNSSSIPLN